MQFSEIETCTKRPKTCAYTSYMIWTLKYKCQKNHWHAYKKILLKIDLAPTGLFVSDD